MRISRKSLYTIILVSIATILIIRAGMPKEAYSNKKQDMPSVQKISAINPGRQAFSHEPYSDGYESDSDERSIPGEEVENSITAVRIMSFNINHGADRNNKINLNRLAEEIIAANADIIGLQEVDKHFIRSGFVNQVKFLSERLEMDYIYGENINVLGNKYGNAVLSRFPIAEFENVHLPGKGEQRGLLKSRVSIADNDYYIFVTHLGLSVCARYEQIQEINRHIDSSRYNTVLMGDFNFLMSGNECELIHPHLLDAALIFDMDDHYTYAHHSHEYNVRIDRIYITPDIKAIGYRVLDTQASDHRGIIMDIEITDKD